MEMKRLITIYLAATVLLAMANMTKADPVNLVTDGGFELGSGGNGDFPGWTVALIPVPPAVLFDSESGSPHPPHSGSQAAQLGSQYGNFSMVQFLSTVPSQEYQFSFWELSDGDTPNLFQAYFNSFQVLSIQDDPSHDYQQYIFNVFATGTSTPIEFISRDDPGYLALDDVVVAPIPEPATVALLTLGGLAMSLRRK
jgi:hypothetical protein